MKFLFVGKSENSIPFSEPEVDQVFLVLIFSLFNCGVCLPFNKESELHVKRNQKSNNQKIKLGPEQI